MWWVSKHLENWRGMPILNCVFKQSFTENVIFLKDKMTVWWKTERIQFLAKKIVCANASSGNMLRGFNEWIKRKSLWLELSEWRGKWPEMKLGWDPVSYWALCCHGMWILLYGWQVIWYVLKRAEACQASFSCFLENDWRHVKMKREQLNRLQYCTWGKMTCSN